jgi:hypothetical protein
VELGSFVKETVSLDETKSLSLAYEGAVSVHSQVSEPTPSPVSIEVRPEPFGANGAQADRSPTGRFIAGNRAALVVGEHSAEFWSGQGQARRRMSREILADAWPRQCRGSLVRCWAALTQERTSTPLQPSRAEHSSLAVPRAPSPRPVPVPRQGSFLRLSHGAAAAEEAVS